MTPLTGWFHSRPREFRCRGCGGEEAFRSRPRGVFEAYVLPVFFLQPVRCGQCYLRSYVSRSVAARERIPTGHVQRGSAPVPPRDKNSRVA